MDTATMSVDGRFEFKALPGYFVQDDTETEDGGYDFVSPSFSATTTTLNAQAQNRRPCLLPLPSSGPYQQQT